jgi:group I intron endonuclease
MNKVSVQSLNECFNLSGEDFIAWDDSDYEQPKICQPWNKGKSGLYQHTEETLQLMSENQRGSRNTFYGKTHSEKTKSTWKKRRMGEGNSFYGKTHTEETNRKITSRHRKHYQFISPHGEVFERYITIREFCRKMGICRTTLKLKWEIYC